ncbi:MAG: DUF2961 domain-containing protein, partial [Lentisphaerae bacterium]|nr:DUF2961 domain-containing protein [Lentisphaerota bacterium]
RRDAEGLVELASLEGPGCVTRIWQTSVKGDAWLLFFDGESTPRLSLSTHDLFSGTEPFLSPLAMLNSGARHNYVGLPYEKSLRIAVRMPELQPQWMQFYHVNYARYPRGVAVESFPEQPGGIPTGTVEAVRSVWLSRSGIPGGSAFTAEGEETRLEPGGEAELFAQTGAGTITRLAVAAEGEGPRTAWERARMLRGLVLRMFWDGAGAPSVETPLGDFFCNGLHKRRFAALPLESREDGFVCRFPMPFRKSARITVRNDEAFPVLLRCAVAVEPGAGASDRYFHAAWTQSMSSGVPFRLLHAEGRGHYVGCYLLAHGMDGTWNMLEGDEVIRVDGADGSTLHGTGLEDYFNGGWYYYGLYAWPLCGLVEKAGMQTAQYRFHLPDRVGFDKQFTMTFEFGDANRSRGYMSGVAYWYQDRPVPAGTQLPPPDRRRPPPNKVARAATMCELFELERAGLIEEAIERCGVYTERFSDAPEAGLLALRSLAYRERLEGFDAVAAGYRAVADEGAAECARQAADLLWFHEAPTNALLGAHVNGTCDVFLDGEPVLSGDNPLVLNVARVGIAPGEHTLAAKVTATRVKPWCRLTLRTHTREIMTDGTWPAARDEPPGWPAPDPEAGGAWEETRGRDGPPWIEYWVFMPNAYVGMQARKGALVPRAGWKGGRTMYFCKRFVIPEEPDGEAGTVPVNPAEPDWDEAQERATDGSRVPAE